jgi:hypothetical protein
LNNQGRAAFVVFERGPVMRIRLFAACEPKSPRVNHEQPDRADPLALLRARREQPSGYTVAEKCGEFPPPHGAYPKAKDTN